MTEAGRHDDCTISHNCGEHPEWRCEQVWQVAIHAAIDALDQHALDMLAFTAGLFEYGAEFEAEAKDYLARSPHEVQQFWLGQCNCDGHLN